MSNQPVEMDDKFSFSCYFKRSELLLFDRANNIAIFFTRIKHVWPLSEYRNKRHLYINFLRTGEWKETERRIKGDKKPKLKQHDKTNGFLREALDEHYEKYKLYRFWKKKKPENTGTWFDLKTWFISFDLTWYQVP